MHVNGLTDVNNWPKPLPSPAEPGWTQLPNLDPAAQSEGVLSTHTYRAQLDIAVRAAMQCYTELTAIHCYTEPNWTVPCVLLCSEHRQLPSAHNVEADHSVASSGNI